MYMDKPDGVNEKHVLSPFQDSLWKKEESYKAML